MFYGCISTDIKKSSTLWSNLPLWMFKAVMRTNNITEYIFENTRVIGIDQQHLSNSPEGDAYTFSYQCEDEEKLKKHVKNVAHCIQKAYSWARMRGFLKATDKEIDEDMNRIDEKEVRDKTRKFVDTEEFYRAIFVRIGVAFSSEAPIQYDYVLDAYANVGSVGDRKLFKSLRGSVIDESERAEAGAEYYKGAISVTQPGEPIISEKTTDENSKFKRDGFPDVPDVKELALAEDIVTNPNMEDESTIGVMMFIHYHFGIDAEALKKDPHLYAASKREFEEIHDKSLQFLKEEINGKKNKYVHIVKIKRNADSMIFIERNGDTPAVSTIWNACLNLTAALPKGSSIGICVTNDKSELTRLKPTRGIPYKFDYFGNAVNLAARMCKMEWQYKVGTHYQTLANKHSCRVAFCFAENRGGIPESEMPNPINGKTKFHLPIEVEKIPRSVLNAGKSEDLIRVYSAHVIKGDEIHVGDKVTFKEDNTPYEGIVTDLLDFLSVRVRVKNERRKRKKYLRDLTKVHENNLTPLTVEKIDSSTYKGGFQLLKL